MKKTEIKIRPRNLSVVAPASVYETDFYKWSQQQAKSLKSGDFENLDLKNLKEEIESLGKSDKRALNSHLIVLLMYLLKIKYQPSKHTKSWDRSVNNARYEMHMLLFLFLKK